MIKTFYGLGTLDTGSAFFAALLIGIFFGLALERAGFGSSRRLAGIFYFRDMAVLKVMFTALLTALLGLAAFIALGLIDPATQIYYMPTYYGTYCIAGLIFGFGFVMGGWCPGTAAVGLASGKIDALFFLAGGIIGSVVFNEVFPLIKTIYQWGVSSQENFGQPGLAFVYQTLGISKPAFAFGFTLIAVLCFWGAEYIERRNPESAETGRFFNTPFLKAFSLALVFFAASLFLLPPHVSQPSAQMLLESIAAAEDHVEPEDLAERLMQGDANVIAVDVRPTEEYEAFHIRGAVNVQLPDLPQFAQRHKDKSMIILYSNGMTHPAQARDILFRSGYSNVYILTDGLIGFVERCLKPVSLRSEPLLTAAAAQINQWRDYFYGQEEAVRETVAESLALPAPMPGMVDTVWLLDNLKHKGLKVIDARAQAEYNTGHIPGSFCLAYDSLRGVVDGVPSVLLPTEMLAAHFALMGIQPNDMVVLVYGGDKVRDATLVGMAFERLGHKNYAILDGGFDKWAAEGRPLSTELPPAMPFSYPVRKDADRFTVDYRYVVSRLNTPTVILDVRPEAYFKGEKSDEARAGHIPGAVNRPYAEDLIRMESYFTFKPTAELASLYAAIIPSRETPVIVHCRTGHQASQTFFVLKYLIGYPNVFWYDAGWTEWSARKELPVASGLKK